MKPNKKPLKLKVETVRPLRLQDLKHVAGGYSADSCIYQNCVPHNSDTCVCTW